MLEILNVESGSIAEELGLQAGDRLLSVNGESVCDLIDYLVAENSEHLLLEIAPASGDIWEVEIEHDSDEPLGLMLPHPEPSQCGNNCIFCFVHQLPRGMRRPLYVKDEDYRFSYLYGAYVTLTNISETDLDRILSKQLSPLYVSVHATDNGLRQQLLGRQAPPILPILQRLIAGGIEVHTQIVVCPGYNDGEPLHQTCSDLIALAPGIKSLAIVPVGLTGHRQNLPELRPLTPAESAEIIGRVEAYQVECLRRLGSRLIFAADELYLNAGIEFPDLASYEDLSQIENGVGLIPQFRSQATDVLLQAVPLDLPAMSLVTGVSAADDVSKFVSKLAEVCGLDLKVHVMENQFFGGHVTVTGLLTGQDLLQQLPGKPLGEILLVPEVMFRENDDLLLDDLSVADLEQKLDVQIEVVAADPWGLWDTLETLALERGHHF